MLAEVARALVLICVLAVHGNIIPARKCRCPCIDYKCTAAVLRLVLIDGTACSLFCKGGVQQLVQSWAGILDTWKC